MLCMVVLVVVMMVKYILWGFVRLWRGLTCCFVFGFAYGLLYK